MTERVHVMLNEEAAKKEFDPAMLTTLTQAYQKDLLDALEDGYGIVDQPGPGVLKLRVAITGIKPSSVSNTMSTILPVGWVVSAVTKGASDDNLGTGEAATEMELLDSQTGTRLASAVDKRQGSKSAFRGEWVDTEEAFAYWAKRLRERLDQMRAM